MNFPIGPFVRMNKHADSAVRERKKSVREPDDQLGAGSAALDKHRNAIANVPLNSIHSDLIHQARDGSLKQVNHLARVVLVVSQFSAAERHSDSSQVWFRGVILKRANSPPRITARRGVGV